MSATLAVEERRPARVFTKTGQVTLDAGRLETRQERRERHRADATLVSMKQVSAMSGISHARIKELNSERGKAQRVMDDRGADPELKEVAKKFLKTAIPTPTVEQTRVVLWEARLIWPWLEDTLRVDAWDEPRQKSAPGERTRVDRVGK